MYAEVTVLSCRFCGIHHVIRLESTMSLFTSSREELKRSPLTVIATVIGVLVSTLALLVAWLQYAGVPVAAGPAANVPPAQLRVSNLLVVLAFFGAASLSLSSAVRLLARVHWFAALVVSVLVAVLAAFGTMVMLHLAPPKSLGSDALATAQDLVFWGTAIVFVAVNGLPVLRDLARPNPSSTRPSDSTDGLGALTGAMFVLLAWGGLVSAGLSKLVRLFIA